MLSIAKLVSIEHAMNYYEHDNYYAKEEERGFTEWIGKTSEELGIIGKIKLDEFNKMLRGQNLKGEKLVQGKDKEQKISYESYFKFKSSLEKKLIHSSLESGLKEKIVEITNDLSSDTKKITTQVMDKYEKKMCSVVNQSQNLSIDDKQILKKSLKKEFSIYKKSASRRPAYDLTFSAPKSISIAALVDGNQELINAHREAVRFALSVVENEYSQITRIDTEKNRRVHENSGNIIAALFEHDVSRKLDPQLHTHCVIMNMTNHCVEWRALNSDGFFYRSKKLGSVYQNELARRVMDLGYDIKLNKNGTFDIIGYKEEQLRFFSKRSEQLKELGATSQKEATKIVKVERDKKLKEEDSYLLHELRNKWKQECKILNIEHPLQHKRPGLDVHSRIDIEKIISDSVDNLTQNEVSFKKDFLETEVLSKLLGSYSYEKVQLYIDDYLSKNARLLEDSYKKEYITKKSLHLEDDTIKMLQRGKDLFEGIVSKEEARKITDEINQKSIEYQKSKGEEPKGINQGQRQAIEVLLTSNDRVFCWQGVAGAGKTFSLYSATRIALEKGYKIKGLAPSSEAKDNLAREAKLDEASTIASLLATPSQTHDANGGKELWIVDEAGLLSAKDAHDLIEKAEIENARILFVGDTKQLSSVGAGNPFKQLQQHGMQTAYLTEGLRQKDLTMKNSVDFIAAQEYRKGLESLEKAGKIFEEGKESIISSMAVDYLSLNKEEREKSLFISSTNHEKREITNIIRSELKNKKELSEGIEIKTYVGNDLNEYALRYSGIYSIGDIIVLNKRSQGLKANIPYQVVKVNNIKNTVVVSFGKEEKEIKLENIKCNLFNQKSIDICVGDRIKWTRNQTVKTNNELIHLDNHEKIDKIEKHLNGQYFTIKSIDKSNQTAIIEYDHEKKELRKRELIDLRQNHFIDYSYVTTVFSSQGKTCDKVYASLTNIDRENFYVAISRAQYDCKIYTHDKNDFYNKVLVSGANETAYEKINTTTSMRDDPERIFIKKQQENTDKKQTESQLEAIRIWRKAKEKSFEVIYRLNLKPNGRELSLLTGLDANNYDIILKEINSEINNSLGVKKDYLRSKLNILVLKEFYERKFSETSKIVQDDFYKYMNKEKEYIKPYEEIEKKENLEVKVRKEYTESELQLMGLNGKVKECVVQVMKNLSLDPEKIDLKKINPYGENNQEIISKMFYYRINGEFGLVTKEKAAEGRKQLDLEQLMKAQALVPNMISSVTAEIVKKLKAENLKIQEAPLEQKKFIPREAATQTQQQTMKLNPRRV